MSEQPSSNELSLLPLRVMAAKERGEISADLARDILEGLSHETSRQEYVEVGHQYRYVDQRSGHPIWLNESGAWNGQLPLEGRTIYARAAVKAGERCCCGEYTFWPSTDATMAQVGTTVHRKSGPCYQLPPLNGTAD